MNFKDKIIKTGKTVIRIGSELADIAVQLNDKTGPLGTSAIIFRGLNSAVELASEHQNNYFVRWTPINLKPISEFIFSTFLNIKTIENLSNGSRAEGHIWIATIGEYKIGWMVYSNWKEGPYIPPDQDIDKTLQAISYIMYRVYSNNLTLNITSMGGKELSKDILTDTLPSQTAEDIWQRQDKFITNNHNRSILLYGAPGTGKSYIARYIVQKAGGTSLRLKAREMSKIQDIPNLIRILQPSALLIDDFDRIADKREVLENFEDIHASTKLFLVTVNDITKLDAATLRVGRFDDLYGIKSLDEEVINRLLKDVPLGIKSELCELPIAYIHEYIKIKETLGAEAAYQEIPLLKERVQTVATLEKKLQEEEGE